MARKKIVLSERHENLYNELRLQVKRANQRIVRLEREFGYNTWAVKRLYNYLDTDVMNAITKVGRVTVNKSMSMTKMRAIQKRVENFLNSETSTNAGVRNVIRKQKEGIKRSLEADPVFGQKETDVVENLTDDEIETLYDMLDEDNSKTFVDLMGASDYWSIVTTAKKKNFTRKQFSDSVINHLDYEIDKTKRREYRKQLTQIYHKFIENK